MFPKSTLARFGAAMAGAIMLCVASMANATILYTSSGGTSELSEKATIGFKFSPTVDISVTSLGVFDGGSDGPGLETSHDVAIWDSAGVLLASVNVIGTDSLIDGFRFADISPVLLTAFEDYVIGAYYGGGFLGDKLTGVVRTAADSIVLAPGTIFIKDVVIKFPNVTGTPEKVNANLLFVSVPEPASIAIFGLGLAGLGFFMTRRRRVV